MMGLDTNVLVRYLTQDDMAQGRRASVLVADTVAKGDRCFIGSVVLCELVWVLRGAYGLDKATVVSVLERILATAQFTIEQRDVVRRALEDYREGKGDFADYLIGHHGLEAGCRATATFDRRLRGSALFQVLA
jgi:predicted nucleic-acid-binding protein